MKTNYKKVFGTLAVVALVSAVGFTDAFGYGSSTRRVSGGGGARPVVNTESDQGGVVIKETTYTFSSAMRNGARGGEVNSLQSFLNEKGYGPLVVDGIFGPMTRASVMKFQAANGLVADGIVGPLTRAALNK